MHEYYVHNKKKLKKTMNDYLRHIAPELENQTGKPYAEVIGEIWDYYDKNLLENFPYIGGDDVSGTSNLTGAYYFVAMGEVLKKYGTELHEAGHLMVICYERYFDAQSKLVTAIAKKVLRNPKLAQIVYTKKKIEKTLQMLLSIPEALRPKPRFHRKRDMISATIILYVLWLALP